MSLTRGVVRSFYLKKMQVLVNFKIEIFMVLIKLKFVTVKYE